MRKKIGISEFPLFSIIGLLGMFLTSCHSQTKQKLIIYPTVNMEIKVTADSFLDPNLQGYEIVRDPCIHISAKSSQNKAPGQGSPKSALKPICLSSIIIRSRRDEMSQPTEEKTASLFISYESPDEEFRASVGLPKTENKIPNFDFVRKKNGEIGIAIRRNHQPIFINPSELKNSTQEVIEIADALLKHLKTYPRNETPMDLPLTQRIKTLLEQTAFTFKFFQAEI